MIELVVNHFLLEGIGPKAPFLCELITQVLVKRTRVVELESTHKEEVFNLLLAEDLDICLDS